MSIYFYKVNEKYGYFSNFAPYGFELHNKWWMTSEHYFQAKKFEGTPFEEKVRLADTPMKAAELGRNRTFPLREDWETVKDDIMREAVQEKFSQNKYIKDLLIDTGIEELIEKTTSDYYWGCGTNGTGKNMLGIILMETRSKLINSNEE